MTYKLLDMETIIPDDYPIYYLYVYICDGIITVNEEFSETTVGRWKKAKGFKEIRKFAHFVKGREKMEVGDKVK